MGAKKRVLLIKHVGDVSAICGVNVFAGLREDLGYKRYKGLGVSERFRGETAYRICSRCLAVLRRIENRHRKFTGQKPLK